MTASTGDNAQRSARSTTRFSFLDDEVDSAAVVWGLAAVSILLVGVYFGSGGMRWFDAGLAVLVSASVFGLLVGCLFVLTRAAYRIAEAATYPIFILGGLVVPLSLLPGWLHPVAYLVPLYWGAELLRAAAAGTALPGHAWLLLAATTTAYGALAVLLFDRMIDRVRRDGTLELF